MTKILLSMIAFGFIFALLYASSFIGEHIGRLQIKRTPEHKLRVLAIAEGAVFALLGLLVAFSFAGAYERFEARKVQIIQEANAIYTAYLRLDLLKPELANTLRTDFHSYVQARLDIYDDLSLTNFDLIDDRARRARQMQLKIWKEAVAGLQNDTATDVYDLVIPALNTMFETANAQFAMSKLHPPLAIFALLIVLALLSSFLTGYSAARKKFKNYTYVVCYIFVTTLTLYVIFDLEMPRLGLIRVTAFDHAVMQKLTNITTSEQH